MRYTESKIQREIVRYYRFMHPDVPIFSIPNGAQRNEKQGKRLVDEGLTAGAADLFIPHKSHFLTAQGWIESNGIFVEVKSPEGRQSKAQKIFQKKVENLGYIYLIVKSLDDFITMYEPIKRTQK